jgi:hypothetical protein
MHLWTTRREKEAFDRGGAAECLLAEGQAVQHSASPPPKGWRECVACLRGANAPTTCCFMDQAEATQGALISDILSFSPLWPSERYHHQISWCSTNQAIPPSPAPPKQRAKAGD